MKQLIAGWPPAEQALSAQRWGLPITTPRVLAGMLRSPKVAGRVCRRGSDAGAPQLVRLLVEHGGAIVPRQSALEVEASRLRSWFPMTETADGWKVPVEFALAAFRVRKRERFFIATLLPWLPRSDADLLVAELGVSKLSTHAHRLCTAAIAIAEAAASPEHAAAAEAVEELQSIRSRDIAAVRYVPGSAGFLFTIRLTDGELIEITPRELAEKAGATFTPVNVSSPTDLSMERMMPDVHIPPIQSIGAVVTFSTVRAADEAFAMSEFKSVVARRIDDRRAATRPSCGALAAHQLLQDLGFHIDEDGA